MLRLQMEGWSRNRANVRTVSVRFADSTSTPWCGVVRADSGAPLGLQTPICPITISGIIFRVSTHSMEAYVQEECWPTLAACCHA